MKVAFRDESFAFEFVRNLGFTYYGGSDIGEMIATAERIMEGDFESWFTEWDKLARRILSRADVSSGAGHLESAREGYLRASTYFRTAEFYLHGDPADPRILSESRASQQAYAEAAKLTGPTWEPVEIPYEGTTLPGYFYKVDNSGKPRPTLIFHGGFDSSLEELFYFGAAAAVRRGYNCLTFDGPGQGAPIREQHLHLRHDWEAVVTPAVDYALTRPDVDGANLALMGMSLGGFLAARAVAFEHRFRAAVFFDGMYDFRGLLPKEAVAALDAGDTVKCENIIQKGMQNNTGLRWAVPHGIWAFGASGIADFMTRTKSYSMEGIAKQIQCPCLVMDAESDGFSNGQPQKIYDALQCPKQLVRFTSEDGAENHCQSGALAYKDEVVFNWLDETLDLHGGRKVDRTAL
ncbi:alpha/beta fold hydrolase [Bradyrhizobium sp. dw_78]|uniref:alpha/beta hydrolase family protein n=1 Tax=Bradyrhizobium sp. dw_78 TaxID=2719793 RepID=UPI001BD2317D|nr:alpha/beta fold hydrolase [Bradyrhizobium sp. dw_78]